MRRDAVAISLYAYLVVLLSAPTLGLVPLTAPLLTLPHILAVVTSGAVWVGCIICLVARVWPWWDELDGRAVEQFGLVIALVGWLLYLYAFARLLPFSWFGFSLVGGFAVAFGTQWWMIRRWRRQLRKLAEADNSRTAFEGP
jgi:hypothetical protein